VVVGWWGVIGRMWLLFSIREFVVGLVWIKGSVNSVYILLEEFQGIEYKINNKYLFTGKRRIR